MMAFVGGLNEFGKNYVDDPEGGVLETENKREVVGEVRIERLTRSVTLLKTDAAAVQQDLIDNEDSPVLYVGKDQPLSYGAGWKVDDIDPENLSASMQRFSIVYRRETQGIFDWQAPDSVTNSCTDGTCSIFFDGNLMDSLESGRDCQAQPLKFTSYRLNSNTMRIQLFCNGVIFTGWTFDVTTLGDIDPENVEDHRLTWEYSGTTFARLKLFNEILKEYSQ